MDSIALLTSSRLTLVDSRVEDGLLKAGWAHTLGLTQPVERVTSADGRHEYAIQTPEFMQQLQSTAELFEPNDTVDFWIADG